MGVEVTSSGGGSPTTPSGINYPAYSTNQFYKLLDAEPYAIDRRSVDNPPFLFPPKQYPDFAAGGTYTIQRGYMRSLISDPNIDGTKAMKNRRLFFQFNPQVLVRSVQQTPGMMNPLLQDPAQLMQPVPGTTSFGFQLMFNREHEVNVEYNDPDTEWLTLPNGDTALVSEVGVLADLLVLDSITGQGISEDMINALVHKSKMDYANKNSITMKEIEALKNAGDEEAANRLKTQVLDIPEQADIDKLFSTNIGNSAFLNPLPFRVLFSTLFMVEGVATSVDVQFQKFSRTMIPTQCTVTINMYALYLGFAKKETFLYNNLIQTAADQAEAERADSDVRTMLNTGIQSANARMKIKSGPRKTGNGEYDLDFTDWNDKENVTFEVTDIRKFRFFDEYLKKDTIREANFSFAIEYYFSALNTTQPSDEVLAENVVDLLQDGKKLNYNAYKTKNVKGMIPMLGDKSIFQNEIQFTSAYPNGVVGKPYFSYRMIMYVKGISSTNNEVRSEIEGPGGEFMPVHKFPAHYNIPWLNPRSLPAGLVPGGVEFTDYRSYVVTPRPENAGPRLNPRDTIN